MKSRAILLHQIAFLSDGSPGPIMIIIIQTTRLETIFYGATSEVPSTILAGRLALQLTDVVALLIPNLVVVQTGSRVS